MRFSTITGARVICAPAARASAASRSRTAGWIWSSRSTKVKNTRWRASGFGKMTVFKPEELYPALTLNSNDAYSSKKMRADITMIRSYYGSRGYADAVVTPDIRDAGPNRVSIIYRITEGSRFRVGRVNIAGNTKTKDKVIRREIPLKPGDLFNSVELETTKARLQNLQYFSDVQATGAPGGAGYRDVNVLVEEKATGSVGVGMGFSSIDSIVGFLTLEQSNFDLFNPWNFTGGGQRFAMNLRAGSRTIRVQRLAGRAVVHGPATGIGRRVVLQAIDLFQRLLRPDQRGRAPSRCASRSARRVRSRANTAWKSRIDSEVDSVDRLRTYGGNGRQLPAFPGKHRRRLPPQRAGRELPVRQPRQQHPAAQRPQGRCRPDLCRPGWRCRHRHLLRPRPEILEPEVGFDSLGERRTGLRGRHRRR